jgi:RNA polymerase sigma factor (sigma-70 family)
MAESAVLAGRPSEQVAAIRRHLLRSVEGRFSRDMEPRENFEANLPAIDRIVARVCWRAGIRGADAEDFGSSVKLALLENDCAILRKHEGRASMATYLAVVIDRMLTDERVRTLGRWDPSTEALRSGPAAVLIERLLRRDHRTLEEVWPIVRGAHPELTHEEAEQIAERLPLRTPRPHFVDVDAGELPPLAAPQRADEHAFSNEHRRMSNETSRIVRETLSSFSLEDRSIVGFHYGMSMSVADISRMMRLPQRPLYRRIERVLATLRRALVAAGIDATVIPGLVTQEMNFGLSERSEAQ